MSSIHLAPMKNITCWAFRNSFQQISDSYTEMLNLSSILSKKKESLKLIDTYNIKNQHQWIQVLTHSITDIKQLPSFIDRFQHEYPEKANIFGVNINACCPDSAVIAAGDGAALIKRTKRLTELIKVFLGSSISDTLHISCKIRLGLNLKEMKYNKISEFLEQLQEIDDDRISPLIIHFRHARQNSDSKPHWEFLERLLQCNYKIVINGGIQTIDDIDTIKGNLSEQTSKKWKNVVSGIMIGKAVFKNPLCFNSFSNKSVNKKNLIDWKNRLINGLKVHPPQDRYITNLNKNCQIL